MKQSAKLRRVQLGLISTSTLGVVIGASLVSPIETKQVRKVNLSWTCFPVHMRTEWYNIVLLLFTREGNGTISYHSNFWFTFPYHPISGPIWNGPLDFFRAHVNATSLCATFLVWNRMDRNRMVRYRSGVNRALYDPTSRGSK